MNLDVLQHLIDKVKFTSTPQFTKAITTERGAIVDTMRHESSFGSQHNAVVIRASSGGINFDINLTTAEASAIMCRLLAQLNKLEEYDAKRNAVAAEEDAN